VTSYSREDELPHRPGPEENWQESVWLQWYDAEAGLGGLHRIGQEVNRGDANALFCLVSDEGTRFRRVLPHLTLRPEDRKGGIGAGEGIRMSDESGGPRLVQREREAEIDLVFEDFHERINLWDLRRDRGAELMSQTAAHHYEVGGRVRGRVRIGDRVADVDGLGYRDHSWGPRDYRAWLSHRWVAGTFGEELTYSLITMHGARGELIRTGYVVRQGKPTLASDIDILAYLEPDGFTHRGGRATARLADGEALDIDFELVDGMVWGLHGLAGLDTICVARCGDLVGQGDFEMTNNATNGRAPITLAIGAALEDGLTQRPSAHQTGGAA
jgi:hypothetical protein